MKTIVLNLQEFLNFKQIFKEKYKSSKYHNGIIEITADKESLSLIGY